MKESQYSSYWSGKYWYFSKYVTSPLCKLKNRTKLITGAGVTRQDAYTDLLKEIRKYKTNLTNKDPEIK